MAAVVACERRERRIVDEVRVSVPYFVVSGYNECIGLLLMRKEIVDASFTVREESDWCSILGAVDYRPKKLFPKRTRDADQKIFELQKNITDETEIFAPLPNVWCGENSNPTSASHFGGADLYGLRIPSISCIKNYDNPTQSPNNFRYLPSQSRISPMQSRNEIFLLDNDLQLGSVRTCLIPFGRAFLNASKASLTPYPSFSINQQQITNPVRLNP